MSSVLLNSVTRRKARVRNKVKSSNKSLRPRIVVSRSNKNFYAQLIDDRKNGNVLLSYSSLNAKDLITDKDKGVDIAAIVGNGFAALCKSKKIESVVFDKGAYLYSGRVKSFADSCRKNGLKF